MAQDGMLRELQTPISARETIRSEVRNNDDCLGCRIVGSAAFVGLGGGMLYTGNRDLNANRQKILQSKSIFGFKTRQSALFATSFSMIGLGLYRWFN
ncbi:hypothetical protein BT63DRAFT_450042 [Microthyrium microscopicum]|uniref:Distal membrane-arm assembly complex protein 1-like domain-containing protein n=1 Tax=Microthyrium microscopicum TaxID=703497 RepID=A0A6A6URV7_9PEZI|nr:hypothetical protein BT63DRAFT_450042 [Microthyrium microscopicum]